MVNALNFSMDFQAYFLWKVAARPLFRDDAPQCTTLLPLLKYKNT